MASIVSDLPHHQLSQLPGAIAITLDKVAAGCEQMQRDCIAGRHAQIASLLVVVTRDTPHHTDDVQLEPLREGYDLGSRRGCYVTGATPVEQGNAERLLDLRKPAKQCGVVQAENRAVLPHMRGRKQGLLVWVSSSSSAGGTPPYLAPYFGAKAAMDAIAVQYARKLSRWGIETPIVVPGAFTSGTNHFPHAGKPADEHVVREYDRGPYAGFAERVQKAFAEIVPPDADASLVADAIVDIVAKPFGQRPFRVHIDPAEDGANVGFAVLDRLRTEIDRASLQRERLPAPRVRCPICLPHIQCWAIEK
jgi:NAD(P)-dependent dehydrogenase (short-subunit alcohol dehydrogenase family)